MQRNDNVLQVLCKILVPSLDHGPFLGKRLAQHARCSLPKTSIKDLLPLLSATRNMYVDPIHTGGSISKSH